MCKLYVSTHRKALERPETGGGWRRTRVRRKRRWPNFIIWRWAGRALGGWIHCLRRAPPLLRRHRRPLTSANPQPGGVSPVWVGVPRQAAGAQGPGRARKQPSRQPSEAGEKPLAREPRRAPAARLSAAPNLPRRVVGARHGRAHANHRPGRAAGSQPAARARVGRPPASAPRRDGAAGDARPPQPFPSSRASAAAQLINAMWVKAWGKFPRNSPLAGSISSE
jgi:hypothetical protein